MGRDAEVRSKLDHEKLAKSYEEQQQTYIKIITMLERQEEMMADLIKQDKVLEAQDIVLEEQTQLLKSK